MDPEELYRRRGGMRRQRREADDMERDNTKTAQRHHKGRRLPWLVHAKLTLEPCVKDDGWPMRQPPALQRRAAVRTRLKVEALERWLITRSSHCDEAARSGASSLRTLTELEEHDATRLHHGAKEPTSSFHASRHWSLMATVPVEIWTADERPSPPDKVATCRSCDSGEDGRRTRRPT